MTGTLLSQRRYLPYGETRWSSGPFPTDRRFTGQREEVTLGVYDYGARFYSPGLGRFLSADTLVPEAGRPQSLNRYMYTLGNPLKYIDPSGHFTEPAIKDYLIRTYGEEHWLNYWLLWNQNAAWMSMLYEAHAGDDFAAMTGENTFSFFKFTGDEDTLLTGAELIGGPGEREQGSFGRIDLLDYQRGVYGRCVSGLLRRTEGQLEVRPTQPFLLPDAYSTIGMSGYHQVSALESTAKGLLVETTAALAMFAIESKVPGFGEWFKSSMANQVFIIGTDVAVGYTVGQIFKVDDPGTHKLYFDYGVVTPALLPGYDYYTTFARYVMAWQ